VTATNPAASQQTVVAAALVLLERMGLTPADLAAVPQDRGLSALAGAGSARRPCSG